MGPETSSAAAGARPAGLAFKQRLALFNWRRRRRHLLRSDIAFLTACDVVAAGADHVAVTGDLTNAGLPDEFHEAACWLDALVARAADRASVVPGNHDAMAEGTWAAGAAQLGLGGPLYPWCRKLGPIALIGLSSALPSLPLLATGTLGEAQISAVEAMLAGAAAEGLARVVLVHHPPGETTSWRRALSDRDALGAALSRSGVELVLYGHNHRHETVRIGTARILALGAPAASAAYGTAMEPAGWHAIAIEGEPGAWSVTVTLRRLQADGRFEDEWTHRYRL